MDSSTLSWSPDRLARAARWLFLFLSLATLAAWVAEAKGLGPPPVLSRAVVLGVLVTGALWLVLATIRLWRRQADDPVLTPGRILVVLVALSFVVRWTGIQFELMDHYFNDEGVFYEFALGINEGGLLPQAFNYGHFLYYASALVLWLFELFPQTVTSIVEALYGFDAPGEVGRLLLRALTATLGALTTIPVFVVGRKVGGVLAGTVGALLILFSPLYNEVCQLTISDVPAGFFATLTMMYVSRILDGETWRDYLLAGVCAGLAAGSKYPGGVAAVAIVGVWIYWRLRARRLSWHLLGAGLVSLTTFLAIMPALWLDSGGAFTGQGLDIMFGWRQYARGGWIGTMPPSNFAWYAERLVYNFGAAAFLIGLAGLICLTASQRQRFLALLPYPVLYLWLIVSMNMVVMRNLQPVLPTLAALLGIGIAAWSRPLARLAQPQRRLALVGICLASLATGAARTVAADISHTRPGTRQLALAFLEENYPWGTAIVHEAYTPFPNWRTNATLAERYAAQWPMEELRSGEWDLLILTPHAYGRFFTEQRGERPWVEEFRARYEEMFTLPLEGEFAPGRLRAGPHLFIYRLDPQTIRYATERTFVADDVAFLSHEAIRSDDTADYLHFDRKGRSVLFKEYFEPGRYRVDLQGEFDTPRGGLLVYSRDNEEVAALRVDETPTVDLPRRDKYYFRLFMDPPAVLRAFSLSRVDDE